MRRGAALSHRRSRAGLVVVLLGFASLASATSVVVTHGDGFVLGGKGSLVGGHGVKSSFPIGNEPWSVTFDPTGTKLYVVDRRQDIDYQGDLVVLAWPSRTVTARIPVGKFAGNVVLPNQSKAYVPLNGDDAVAVVDLATNAVATTIPLDGANDIALNAAGTRAYVTSYDSDVMSSPLGAFTVIDTATDTVIASQSFPYPLGSVAVAPDGSRAYAGLGGYVLVIDVATMSIVQQINVGGDVNTLLIHPSGAELYVELFCVAGDNDCSDPGAIAVVDTATDTVRARVPVDRRPQGMALDRRGRKLFVTHGLGTVLLQIKTGCAPAVQRRMGTIDTTVGVAVRGKPAQRPPRAPCR
jgi:DNA-binding beta-propeller fold protein YncE